MVRMRASAAMAGALLAVGCSPGTDLPAGEKAIAAFHAQLDAGAFDEIYSGSGAGMKSATTRKQMTQLYAAVHRKLGAFQSGKTLGWQDNVTTGGHLLGLTYAAKYQHGDAQETFTFRLDGEKPVLEGYFVNSQALILN